jgi:excisionase family DNA binding protein
MIEPMYMNGKQAAVYLGISPRTLRDWQRRRKVPYYKTSAGDVRYCRKELDDAMRRFRVPAMGES